MSPKALKTLREAAKFVGDEKAKGTAPELVILALLKNFGAKRAVSGGAHTLRCGTVAASCTWSRDKGLLDNWNRNATIRLAREAMA